MSDTGRIREPVGLRTRRQIYGTPSLAETTGELTRMTLIDLAHVVMLAEQGLIRINAAGALLRTIEDLRRTGFAALTEMPTPRGVYLAYERYLVVCLGENVGGVLHTGRSRNDMKATVTLTRLRDWLLSFVEETTRLVAVLLSRGRKHHEVVMPVHTHFQAAMPITYGYYLVGVASALTREIESLRDAARRLRHCPMGANAIAGTDLALDPTRTAALLGFQDPPLHALDVIASRDAVLAVLAASTGVSIVLSRLGTDLQLWSTEEFGFVRFPDRLVGGSSAMPQKRNAFLLEHVTAAAGAVGAAWTGAMTTMKGTPFTNSIEVGSEAVGLAWSGFGAAMDAVLLSQVLVSGAQLCPEQMLYRAEEGFTTATAVANHLVRQGVPFRTAHHAVGAAVRDAISRGERRLSGSCEVLSGTAAAPDVTDPRAAAERTDIGGGPGAWHVAFDDVYGRLSGLRRWRAEETARLARAGAELSDAVRAVLAGMVGRGLGEVAR